MHIPNHADNFRRLLLSHVIRVLLDGNLEEMDKLTTVLVPEEERGAKKDRYCIRERCMAALGFRIEDSFDPDRALADYAKEAVDRFEKGVKPWGPNLTIIPNACSACMWRQTIVSNMCRGCFGRPCTMACRKDAIHVTARAKIDVNKCVNCGMCVKACPYHAIIEMPLPCMDPCPVGAVGKDEKGRVTIDWEKCINCGKCANGCPFNTIVERSQIADIVMAIKSGKRVIAMPAPAIFGIFPGTPKQMYTALKKLGFSDVCEVSYGAEITSKCEADELRERIDQGHPFMTTSCCPAWFQVAEKHIPEIAPFVSHTHTPMQYTADSIREEEPDVIIVFLGPCMAKRVEAQKDNRVDYVMTADELDAFFRAAEIDITKQEDGEALLVGEKTGCGYPISGGVAGAVKAYFDNPEDVKALKIDGLDAKQIKALKAFAKNKKALGNNLIEVMVCPGGCIAGPSCFENIDKAYKKVRKLLDGMEGPDVFAE